MNIMASYFKYEDVHKLPNRKIYSSRPPVHVTNFGENRSKVKVTLAHNVYR